MWEHDMAYGPVAPHWINIDDNNITLEGCLLYICYTESGHAPAVIGRFKHFWVQKDKSMQKSQKTGKYL